MQTKNIKYSEVKTGDKIFYKPNDHERRKLDFNEIEVVKQVFSYNSKGNGNLVLLTFESNNKSLGFPSAEINEIV